MCACAPPRCDLALQKLSSLSATHRRLPCLFRYILIRLALRHHCPPSILVSPTGLSQIHAARPVLPFPPENTTGVRKQIPIRCGTSESGHHHRPNSIHIYRICIHHNPSGVPPPLTIQPRFRGSLFDIPKNPFTCPRTLTGHPIMANGIASYPPLRILVTREKGSSVARFSLEL